MNHPILPIYIQSLDLELPKKYLYDHVIEQHEKHKYNPIVGLGNSFKIKDTKENHFDRLYDEVLKKANNLFGELKLLENNSRNCLAYVTNKNHYRNGIHHHSKSSVINSVFYLHMPKTEKLKEGSLSFYDDSGEIELFWYKPKIGDLIFFPHYMKHEPNPILTEEYRICINIEIQCENVWNN